MNSALNVEFVNGTVCQENSSFIPIPQLLVPDADLLVVFLSGNGVVYLHQINDPWYRAANPSVLLHFRGETRTGYTSEEAASPLGSVQRHQFCNSSKICGSLTSWADAVTGAPTLFHQTPKEFRSGVDASYIQDAVASRFAMFEATLKSASSISSLIANLGSFSLLSTQHFIGGHMGPLPDNQWQLDVSHWFAMRMAALQATFVNVAHGPRDESVLPYRNRPNEYQRTLCDNQVSSN